MNGLQERLKKKWEELSKQQKIIPSGQSSSSPPRAQANAPPPIPPRPEAAPRQPPGLTQPYWAADFASSADVSTQWEYKLGNNNGWGNNELQHYTASPDNSFFNSDNKLVVRAISAPTRPENDTKYTSARLVSRQTLGRNKGCLTTHLSLPCAPGIWPAFWLLPKEPYKWPEDGEIDIAETWNGDCENHSCLHWGYYTPQDRNKHLVRGTRVPDMASGRPIRFDFVWNCPSGGPGGRLMWYVDNRPVMKATMPSGTRPIDEWCILINVAMGGNVCAGKTPAEGSYDYVVHGISLNEQPEGGWDKFEKDQRYCPVGVRF